MKAGLPVKPTKTHKGENFPVASLLIAPKHRAAILAYYRFARAADDVADSPSLTPDDKLAGLDLFEATLLGHCDTIKSALPLRVATAIPIEVTGARSQNASAEVSKGVPPYSGVIANVHSEPPVGTAPPMARRARPPPKPEAMVTYCRPLCT